MRVLVVDDDRATCCLQTKLLQRAGYEAFCCHDGADAMEVIERVRPEVILLDLSMPQMDGFTVAEELRHNPDLRPKSLIAVTGYGQDEVRAGTRTLGFGHHLLKPAEWSQLSQILEQAGTDKSSVIHSHPASFQASSTAEQQATTSAGRGLLSGRRLLACEESRPVGAGPR